MTKKELIAKIHEFNLLREFALITFTNGNDKFFQFFGSARIGLEKFINFNFKIYEVKEICDIKKTPQGCVIVNIK